MNDEFRIDLPDLAATEAFGCRLGEALFAKSIVALDGPLGAGKTHLSRAIAVGLGIRNAAAVTSPTFVLIQEYPARLPIFHFDAYRLSGTAAFVDLGVDEYFEAGGVCLIEWAERIVDCLPDERLHLRIEIIDDDARRIHLSAVGERHRELLRGIGFVEPIVNS